MIGTTLLTQLLIPAILAMITAWIGWYFGKKKTTRELKSQDLSNEAQDLNNDSTEIDNLRKTMDALTDRLTKEIERLTDRVELLEKKLDQKERIIEIKSTINSQAYSCKYAPECPVIKKQLEIDS